MHIPTCKPDDMITTLYSPGLIKQEYSPYTIGGSHHMMPPPPAPPVTMAPLSLDSSTAQTIPPNITLNSLSPDTSAKDPTDLG